MRVSKARTGRSTGYAWHRRWLAYGRAIAVVTRGGNRMRESCTYGSVRGAPSNGRPYRDRRDFITLIGGAAALAARGARAAAGDAGDRVHGRKRARSAPPAGRRVPRGLEGSGLYRRPECWDRIPLCGGSIGSISGVRIGFGSPSGDRVRCDYPRRGVCGKAGERGALLADGSVDGDNLICGVHNWDYP